MFLKTGKTQSRRNRKEVSAMAVTLNAKYLEPFVHEGELQAILPQVEAAHRTIHEKSGPGNDFLGWLDLPVNYDREEFDRILKAAQKIRSHSQVLVVIGIGGSYLGARALQQSGGRAADLFCGQQHQPDLPQSGHQAV